MNKKCVYFPSMTSQRGEQKMLWSRRGC